VNKILLNLSVLLKTRTQKPAGYFQVVFLLHTLATTINKINIRTATVLRNYIYKNFNRELIIRNDIGVFCVNAKDDSFIKSIPTYEVDYQPWLSKPKERNIMIDIGSNIGFFSILALNKYGYQSVYAFEPHPQAFSRLEKNVYLNKLEKNMHVFNVPLSSTQSVMDFKAGSVHTGGSSLEKDRKEEECELLSLQTNTFDKISKQREIKVKNIDFIKIDVEGHENEVLIGMEHTLREVKTGTHLFIELNSDAAETEQTKKFLKKYNFAQENLANSISNYLFVKN